MCVCVRVCARVGHSEWLLSIRFSDRRWPERVQITCCRGAKHNRFCMGREPARKHFTSGGRAGHANFDLAKETLHVVSRTIPEGENFRLLVTTLGCKLMMVDAVQDLVAELLWMLRALLRSHRSGSNIGFVQSQAAVVHRVQNRSDRPRYRHSFGTTGQGAETVSPVCRAVCCGSAHQI